MVPFIHHNRTAAEERFNRALCKTQSKIECTLGILQNRFVTLLKRLHVHGPEYCLQAYYRMPCHAQHMCFELGSHRSFDGRKALDEVSRLEITPGRAKRQHIVNTYFT